MHALTAAIGAAFLCGFAFGWARLRAVARPVGGQLSDRSDRDPRDEDRHVVPDDPAGSETTGGGPEVIDGPAV